MFEKLVGTISGIKEGLGEAAAAKRQEAARIREENREAARATKAAAKAAARAASKDKLDSSKTARRAVTLGVAAMEVGDVAADVVETGKVLRTKGRELSQKIKPNDPEAKLAALVGMSSEQAPQEPEHSQPPPTSTFSRGGLPPV